MKILDYIRKKLHPVRKSSPAAFKSPTIEKLRTLTTDELVKILLKPELSHSMNTGLRHQIIMILQEREGNSFVQRLFGKKNKPEKLNTN